MIQQLNTEMTALFETSPYREILALIRSGEWNAVPLRELVRRTGLHERVLRLHIERLRREGIVIISGNQGYYFPARLGEIQRYRRREESRAKAVFFTLKSTRTLEKEVAEQEEGHNVEQ